MNEEEVRKIVREELQRHDEYKRLQDNLAKATRDLLNTMNKKAEWEYDFPNVPNPHISSIQFLSEKLMEAQEAITKFESTTP